MVYPKNIQDLCTAHQIKKVLRFSSFSCLLVGGGCTAQMASSRVDNLSDRVPLCAASSEGLDTHLSHLDLPWGELSSLLYDTACQENGKKEQIFRFCIDRILVKTAGHSIREGILSRWANLEGKGWRSTFLGEVIR